MKQVKKIGLLFLGGVLAVIVLAVGMFVQFEKTYKNRVYPDVYLEQTPIEGFTRDKLQQLILSKSSKFEKTSLTLTADGHIATISAEKLKLAYDIPTIVNQAFSVGRNTHIYLAYREKISRFLSHFPFTPISISPTIITPSIQYQNSAIDSTLDAFSDIINIDPVEPQFEFDKKTKRVTFFSLGKNGKKLDKKRSKELIHTMLTSQQKGRITVNLPVITIYPKTNPNDINNLGIVELLAKGESFFKGSIPGRVHNITLAASRVSGILVAPGEIFSFNDTVGDISAATGYKSSYIIKNGRTILGDGGGVCQVSTTLFRAALNAGLEIVERTPHSYRVTYYEQGGYKPGLDATVYRPTVDLKIKNNTENYILITSEVDAKNFHLSYFIYGTKDDRKITIGDVKFLSTSPAPPPLYQEDPTLPTGTIKQVDWAAKGAKVKFDYEVSKANKVLFKKTFYSNFRPWQAVYLYGPGTPIPQS